MPYFYQHSNGQIIEKPNFVVESSGNVCEYFASPFVRDWWFESDLLRPVRSVAPEQTPTDRLRAQLKTSLAVAND